MYKTIRAFSLLPVAEQQKLLAKMNLFVWESDALREEAGLHPQTAGMCCRCLVAVTDLVFISLCSVHSAFIQSCWSVFPESKFGETC